MSAGPPLLLTGLPRSGTTWVGKVLTAGPSVFGIDEPFNPKTRPRLPLDYPARHLGPEAPVVVSPALRRSVAGMLSLRVRAPRGLELAKPKHVLQDLDEARQLVRARATGAAVMVKDPTANFLTRWLHDEFGVRPVVLVRHPCGNAAGYLRMRWSGMEYYTRSGPLAQLLPDDRRYLERHRDDLAGDPVLSAAIDWRITNGMLLALRDSIPDLVVVRYEDLAADPATRFPALAGELGLGWGPANQAVLDELKGDAVDQAALGSALHVMKRDPGAAASSWRDRLAEADVETVFQHAGPLVEQLGYGR